MKSLSRKLSSTLLLTLSLATSLVINLGLIDGAWAASPTPQSLEPLSNFPQSMLTIVTPDARQHRLQVWLADTDRHREQGLMFVKELPQDVGMLFIFDRPQRIQMWMKNTLIPLDMLFIDANGRVDSIISNATPQSLKILSSASAVLGVLELAGGSAAQLGIHAGAIVQHPLFASVGGSR